MTLHDAKHDRRIDYIEMAATSIAETRRFHFADPSGNELAVWSDR
jgi:predicted enzyme related to lactoylglutathione lyase